MIVVDGSLGEGGGQVLRSALTLSLITRQPFRIDRIRAGRKKPGLLRQHLTSVEAARQVGHAEVRGASLGSARLDFAPHGVFAGDYQFDIGSAGSTTLVLQTVLPALLSADGPSRLSFVGGTHNPFAPPVDFLERVFLPIIERMGSRVGLELHRPGFYPQGGGCFSVTVEPGASLRRVDLIERGALQRGTAQAIVAGLPRHIAERELSIVRDKLNWEADQLSVEELPREYGPGNVLMLEARCEHGNELVTAFGERGVSAEQVATKAVAELRQYLDADVPVGEHLADQLLLPFALAGGGSFRTLPLSSHARTNIDVLKTFLNCDVDVQSAGTAQLVSLRAAQ